MKSLVNYQPGHIQMLCLKKSVAVVRYDVRLFYCVLSNERRQTALIQWNILF